MPMAKILIVEDDILLSRMYGQAFGFDGFEVEVAYDGQEGLEKAQTQKPALILLDIMMPRLNGLQTLEKLKNDPQTKKIPVIMLTNLSDEDNAKTALERGAVKYIVKSSYRPKQVCQMVKEIL